MLRSGGHHWFYRSAKREFLGGLMSFEFHFASIFFINLILKWIEIVFSESEYHSKPKNLSQNSSQFSFGWVVHLSQTIKWSRVQKILVMVIVFFLWEVRIFPGYFEWFFKKKTSPNRVFWCCWKPRDPPQIETRLVHRSLIPQIKGWVSLRGNPPILFWWHFNLACPC